VIPVFYIGKTLVNKWAGALAALLVAIMPGEFLGRTMLGYTDHHVVEILFTTTAMLFLILAVKSGRELQLTVWPFDWIRARRPLLFAMLGGLFFGLYLQMWAGGPVFVLILLIYFAAQFIIDHFKGLKSDYLAVTGTTLMLAASLITLPFLPRYYSAPLYLVGLGGGTLAPAILFVISKYVRARKLPAYTYPAILVIACAVAAVVVRLADRELFNSLLANFNILHPSNVEQTIAEVDPLLFPTGTFSLSVAWLNFAVGFYLAPVMLGVFAWQVWKHDEPQKLLIVVWSVCTLILTLGQRRFAYYYAVNVALLTMCLAWAVLKWAGFREETRENEVALAKELKRRTPREIARRNVFMGIALVAIFAVIIMPELPPALDTVKAVPYAPDLAWEQALTWLRDNSPPPFGNRDAYYDVIVKTNPGQYYAYPQTAYGVLAWWDYGHWITRIAHRIPNNAPGGGRSPKVAECLLSQDEETARQYMKELDSLYVMADYPTMIYKFYAVCEWAGTKRQDYFDTYYQAQNGVLKPVVLFYPEFYRTLLVRLYSFDGQAVSPESTTVIVYVERDNNGETIHLITDVKKFGSYGACPINLLGVDSSIG
jgi:dolichyl-diphosphooligosaccharide--protein glycosyltransferase